MSRGTVVVAMSGGVDSSVAALLLKEAGYRVIGITMRLWTLERPGRRLFKYCCSVEDVEDARRVCQRIGAPHYFLNFEQEFKTFVVDYFIQEYRRGRTPNPCIACNHKLKFHFLMQKALSVGADYIATGHYARVERHNGQVKLCKALDPMKDQSYVLFGLRQEELQKTLFPIGGYSKAEVRSLAREAGLAVADKPDSQEICFIPDGDYRSFLQQFSHPRPGEMVDTEGRVLKRHPGIEFFTVGQRKGLGLATGERLYVVALDPETNRVVVGREKDLWRQYLWAMGVNYTSGTPPSGPLEVTVKVRYKSPETPATLIPQGDGWAEIRLKEPQRAVTPGQAVVFYRGDEVLGGGYIEVVPPATGNGDGN